MAEIKKIGIPTSLYYYTYFPLWYTFFKNIGLDIVLSPQSNKVILNDGIKETVNDACVPIKLFHGHVMSLRGKVDYIFMPRMVSADGRDTFCPKFLGLPDMVRHSVENLPELISDRFDMKKGVMEFIRFHVRIGKKLCSSRIKIYMSIIKAIKVHSRFKRMLKEGFLPAEAIAIIVDNKKDQGLARKGKKITLAVLGYPYAIYDPYVSANLFKKLESLDVNVMTLEAVSKGEMKKSRKDMGQGLFWHYSNQVIWAALHFLRKKNVDGLVHVTAFGCGPDAMVDKLVELEAKAYELPFMSLTIDEHTGEAGIYTRLEAFVDMLKMKKGMA